MPTLVHIADEKNAASILRSGIKPGKHRKVIYFMPVLQDHFISHQWVRELRRHGAKVLVGVYFRLPSSELVWAGKYNEEHRQLPLGEAIHELGLLPDKLGYELFIERKIEASEVLKIRQLPQKIGWRYKPHVHGTKPCGCPGCSFGRYGAQRIRDKYDPKPDKVPYEEIKRRLLESDDSYILSEALWTLRRKRRSGDPAFLRRIMQLDDADLVEDLAGTLAYFRHVNTLAMLTELCGHGSADVRERATESAYEIYKHDAAKLLGSAAEDPVVGRVLAEKQRAVDE